MGHDDGNEYSTAMQARDSEKVRELELKADGIAVLTLEHLGSSPDQLVSAAQKLMHCNDGQDRTAGATPQASLSACDRYVSLDDRIAFIRAGTPTAARRMSTPIRRGRHRARGAGAAETRSLTTPTNRYPLVGTV